MALTVAVDGIIYEDFESLVLSRELENGASVFTIAGPYDVDKFLNLTMASEIKLYIDNELLLTGYVEIIRNSEEATQGDLQVQGRDVASDLIDSTLGTELEMTGPTTLNTIIAKVNQLLGRRPTKVINTTGRDFTFESKEKITASPDTSVFTFLEKYARKKQCFLTSDAKGNLTVVQASSTLTNVHLMHRLNDTQGINNMSELEVEINNTERYGVYRVHNQGNPSGASSNVKPSQLQGQMGIATDPEVRPWRVKDIIAEVETASVTELTQRAQWEATVQKARAITYSCVVPDYKINNTLLRPNMLVKVTDDKFGLNQNMLIKAVEYTSDGAEGGAGFTTKLDLTLPDVYLPEPLTDRDLKRERKRQAKRKLRQVEGDSEVKRKRRKRGKSGFEQTRDRYLRVLQET